MTKRTLNNVKLGFFVMAALVFLVILLYMIGKNRNLFGNNYQLNVRFENIQGLVVGNNVRFAGIQAGTVKKIAILNDTVVEVSLIIEKKMQTIIRKNAIASISTDGLVGNRVVNIVPSRKPGAMAFATDGDYLIAKKAVSTDEMLQTLYNTNNDVAVIAADLKKTVQHINNSTALWSLLNDYSIPAGLRASVENIRLATGKAGEMVSNLDAIVKDIKEGKGSLGVILRDTAIAGNLNDAAFKIKMVAEQADAIAVEMNTILVGIKQDINIGKGTVHALLKDSGIVIKLNTSLENIQQGTDRFNESMEALKHNFLLRGYFRKLAKQKRTENK